MEANMVSDYQILVSGSANLSKGLIGFVESLGHKIATQTNLILATGGLEEIIGEEGKVTVDSVVTKSALNKLEEFGVDAKQRILTLLPEVDWPKAVRFRRGKPFTVPNSNIRSRRFYMVSESDAVITIEGHNATGEIIDLAWILRKPLLPLPFTGGLSLKRWKSYREEIISQFVISPDEISELETDGLNKSVGQNDSLATLSLNILQRRLKPRCFVIMKLAHCIPNIYGTIRGVVEKNGYQAIRIDQVPFLGNIVKAIRNAIESCDMAIADITDFAPNVIYELGLAHALGKKTFICIYDSCGEVPNNIPFDISTERIFPYDSAGSLRTQLEIFFQTLKIKS
jgi:hypothetical protein